MVDFTGVPWRTTLIDETGSFSPSAAAFVEAIVTDANSLLSNFIDAAPQLRCRPRSTEDYGDRPLAVWEALDVYSGAWVGLENLSRATARWAKLAVAVALRRHRKPSLLEESVRFRATEPGRSIVVLDEPEFALHPAARRRLAGALVQLADHVLVSSHSPELLNAYDNVMRVQRSRATGGIQLDLLDRPTRHKLDASWAKKLGMSVGDLAQLVRVVILVEGSHDQIVLEGLLREALSESRAVVEQLGGTRLLSHVADSRLLFDLTEASILLLLDGTDRGKLVRRWQDVQAGLRRGDDIRTATRLMHKGRAIDDTESLLRSVASAAIEAGNLDRLNLITWGCHDVVEILPVAEFLDDGRPWSRLFQDYKRESATSGEPITGALYKQWLRSLGAPVYERGIRQVVDRAAADRTLLEPASLARLERVESAIRRLAGRM